MERTKTGSQHQYRATKLWNEILFAFRFALPLKRHRRHVKVYEECFTATEAIDWLHNFLQNNPNFGPHVTRKQTVELLKKFYKCDVFEEVRKNKQEKQFSDDNRLYRFCAIPTSPQRSAVPLSSRTPLAIVNSGIFPKAAIPPTYDSQKTKNICPLSVPSKSVNPESREQENIFPPAYNSFAFLLWKKLVLRRLISFLSVITLDGILDATKISGQTIVHNVTRMDRNGVVTITDKTDDLPHWILLAMRCLAFWPNASGSGSCLPNYPGYALDVFHVVKEYFINQSESLIPSHLSQLFRLILCQKVKDPVPQENLQTIWCNQEGYKTSTPVSQENNAVATEIPVSKEIGSSSHEQARNYFISDGTVSEASVSSYENPIINPDSANWSSEQLKRSLHSTSGRVKIRRSMSLPRLCQPLSQTESNAENSSRHENHEIHTSMPSDLDFVHSLQDLNRSKYYRNEVNTGFLVSSDSSASYRSLHSDYSSLESSANTGFYDSRRTGLSVYDNGNENSRLSDNPEFKENHNRMAGICTERSYCTESLQQENCDFISNLANAHYESASCDVDSTRRFVGATGGDERKFCAFEINTRRKHASFQDASVSFEKQLNDRDRLELIRHLQFCTLLLDPPLRRKLHMMLQFFQKISCNSSLDLQSHQPVKILLVKTFAQCILHDLEVDSKQISEKLTSFLIDHVEEVFVPPADLEKDFHNIWQLHCKRQMNYGEKSSGRPTYCEQVSQKRYEEQKNSVSRQALAQLLQNILHDPHLSEKQRHRKLNEFKKNHPEVYESEFPTGEKCSEEQYKSDGRLNLISRIKKFRL